jgi:2-oxoacid:acceptor oxidoreductase gamma subunit (pyruvate/2-ketoisovalerate family)
MIEVRFHGRGGQGAVVASKVLAIAFFHEGSQVQSFPSFGVERRGAPILAFLRVDQQPVQLRTNIYNPDHIVVLDPTLVEVIDVTSGLRPGGWIILNTYRPPQEFPQLKTFRQPRSMPLPLPPEWFAPDKPDCEHGHSGAESNSLV